MKRHKAASKNGVLIAIVYILPAFSCSPASELTVPAQYPTLQAAVNGANKTDVYIENNHAPIAEAGLSRYAAQNPVTLDGTGSYDSDGDGPLTYQWQQISGPTLTIINADTAYPTIYGFTQTSSIQRCKFELIVSDGDKNSLPDTVEVIIVPAFNYSYMNLENSSFDPNKPTIIYFSGGNCSEGGQSAGWTSSYPAWLPKANIINFEYYEPPYERCGDMLITYLCSQAPNYQKAIQIMGWSTGCNATIVAAKYLNLTYADTRYAVNRVTFFDAVCGNFPLSDIPVYLANPVGGEQCWVDNYRVTSPIINNTLNCTFTGGADHSRPVLWFLYSIYPSTWSTPMYNQGFAGGEFLSVTGEGRNLQLALTNNITYYFRWFGDADGPGYLTFAYQTSWPGRMPKPVTLLGPADGATVDANGAVLTCEVSDYSVGYQLLMGPDPYHMDYLLSDTNQPPLNQVNTFPFENTYWTIKARDPYGTTIYADPILIRATNVAKPILNPSGRQYLTCTGYDLLRQKRISRTEFEYCLRMRMKNPGFYDVNNKTSELESVSENVQVLNEKVFFSSIPAQQEVSSYDSFIVRINRQTAVDENDIIWRISEKPEGDISGDGLINIIDFGLLADNWLLTDSNMPADLYKDQIIDFRDFAIFAEHWFRN